MKKIIPVLAVIIVTVWAASLIVACRTTQVVTSNPDGTFSTNTVTKVDPDRAKRVSAILTRSAGRIAIIAAKRQALKADFAVAAEAVNILLLNNNYDPDALRAALAKINVPTNDEVFLIGAGLLDVYELLVTEVLSQQLDKMQWLRPVLEGVSAGLKTASL